MQSPNAHLITSIKVKEKMAYFLQYIDTTGDFLGFIYNYYTSNLSWFITFKILKAFPKLSPPKQSLVNDQQMEKKTMQEKRKKRGGEKVKSRSQGSVMCHF